MEMGRKLLKTGSGAGEVLVRLGAGQTAPFPKEGELPPHSELKRRSHFPERAIGHIPPPPSGLGRGRGQC